MSDSINDINKLFVADIEKALVNIEAGAAGGLSISPTGSSSVVINHSIDPATGQAVNSQTQVTQSMNSYASGATTVTQQPAPLGGAPVQTSSSTQLSMTDQSATLTASTTQKILSATGGGGKRLFAADAADETVLSSSKVILGNAGVAVQASSSINMVAGAADAANTAFQQTSDTLEFSVTDPTATPAAGGRKLSGAENKRSLLRVDKNGIQLLSLDKLIMETDVEVSGKLIAIQELTVDGKFTATKDVEVEGELVPKGGLNLSAGKRVCLCALCEALRCFLTCVLLLCSLHNPLHEQAQQIAHACDNTARDIRGLHIAFTALIGMAAAAAAAQIAAAAALDAATLDLLTEHAARLHSLPYTRHKQCYTSCCMPAAAGVAAGNPLILGYWTITQDSNFNLVFKFDGKVQAVLHNPTKPNNCPGTKLTKWCVE
jgi:hypothetical protein